MYNSYGYNPYNRYATQPLTGNPMEMSMQPQTTPQMALNRQNILYGKQVDNLEVVKATDIPLDGSISYFPLVDGSAIVTKQLGLNGVSKIIVYKPTETEEPKKVEYATTDDVEQLKIEIRKLKKLMKEDVVDESNGNDKTSGNE